MSKQRTNICIGAGRDGWNVARHFAIFCYLFLALTSCSQIELDGDGTLTTESMASNGSLEAPHTAAPVILTPSPTAEAVTLIPATTPASMPATASAPVSEVQPFRPADLGYLKQAFDARLQSFRGIASYYIYDLQGGQAAIENGDVVVSGTSIVKIPILLETYRTLDEAPDVAQRRLITETATLSGNYTANLLLELIAGRPDPFVGAQIVSESMRSLGLYDTFIAVPYDLNPDPAYYSTYLTPANQTASLSTNPDSSMQTTVKDMGRLLTMVYDCSTGGGYLLDVHAGALTADECRDILDVMSQNDIDAFIEEGVPEGIPVAHKHGWVGDTHGDAAVIEAPENPYVLVISLYREGWLEWAESTEIIADLSRLAYAHFSSPDAYTGETLGTAPPALPAPAPMPDLPPAVIRGTAGAGLVLRDSPGGGEVMVVPEGSLVFLVDDEPTSDNGRGWRRIRLLNDAEGWVVEEFLELQ